MQELIRWKQIIQLLNKKKYLQIGKRAHLDNAPVLLVHDPSWSLNPTLLNKVPVCGFIFCLCVFFLSYVHLCVCVFI